MPELTPERLREIEARVEQATDGNISSVMLHIEDSEALLAALKQAREERDQLAAALAYARSDIASCFVGCNNCGHSLDLKDLDLMSEIDKVLADPVECLKARDAEKDRRISELEDYCGRAALAIAKSDDDEAYHQLYCAIVRDLTLSAERQAARMNQAMGLTGEQSKAVLSMMRAEIAQEKK